MQARISDNVFVEAKSKRQVLAELDQRVTFELGQLLKEAQPSREKIHILTKQMERELQSTDFESIRGKIISYFNVRFERRTGGQFLRTFGMRPYPWLHNQFILNFSNAQVSDTKTVQLAGRFRHLFRATINPPKEIVETDFLHLTIYKLVHPRCEQKSAGLQLSDLLYIWNRTSQAKWGDKYNHFFKSLSEDLDIEYGTPLTQPPITMGTTANEPANDLELTQTDLDWIKGILAALDKKYSPPKYPLARGPDKPTTRQLEKVVRLMNRFKQGPKALLLGHAARSLCTTYLKAYGQFSS
jgi:hypothetical protein